MKKRALALIFSAFMAMSLFTGCAKDDPTTSPSSGNSPDSGEKPYIAVISKGFQHQFWQTVSSGATAAAEKYGVEITFDGPPSESDIAAQVDMINNAIGKKPVALCLAALDTESVTSQLNDAKTKGIPIIAFDSGVPNAPADTVKATASTDNEVAGALAATEMFKSEAFQTKLANATAENPVVIGIISQDATSGSIVGRTVGFINEMKKLCEEKFPGAVEVLGHDNYTSAASSAVQVKLQVTVPPTTSATDIQTAALAILNGPNLIGFYASNEATANGILAATSDGSDLDRANGKYKELIVVGFDAGKTQKNAVRNNWFYGSVTQDPYMIGYLAVEMAYKAYKGETISNADTGCKFYTSANIDNADISPLVYD